MSEQIRITDEFVQVPIIATLTSRDRLTNIFMQTIFDYATDHPFAVTMWHGENLDQAWTFGRELLDRALKADAVSNPTVGNGDAEFMIAESYPNELLMYLHPPTGEALISLPRQQLTDFISASYELISDGMASGSVQNEIAQEEKEGRWDSGAPFLN